MPVEKFLVLSIFIMFALWVTFSVIKWVIRIPARKRDTEYRQAQWRAMRYEHALDDEAFNKACNEFRPDPNQCDGCRAGMFLDNEGIHRHGGNEHGLAYIICEKELYL